MRIPASRSVGVLLFLSLLAAISCSGTSYHVNSLPPTDFTVFVTDQNGTPLSEVKVMSDSQPDGQPKLTGITDNGGKVTFDNIKSGGYLLFVSHSDYDSYPVTVVASSDFNNLSVKLNPAGIKLPTIK